MEINAGFLKQDEQEDHQLAKVPSPRQAPCAGLNGAGSIFMPGRSWLGGAIKAVAGGGRWRR
jgi:hypothetical protein